MKKLLFGCLGVCALLAVAGGALGYFYVYKPAKSLYAGLVQFEELPRLNARIENKAPFTPPEGGVLTQAMVDRYMSAQQSLRDRMGPRIADLEVKYKAFDENRDHQPSIKEVFGALQDLGALIVDAKRAQVEALNQHGFSLAEYEWTRGAIYEAIGVPLGTTFQDAIRQASGEQEIAAALNRMGEDVPAINRELVKPLTEKLQDNVALAFFGL